MSRTGHRSESGVRKYKRVAPQIESRVSAILDPPSATATSENCQMELEYEPLPKMAKMEQSLRSILPEASQNATFSNCTFNFK